jgi:hypothetical protein
MAALRTQFLTGWSRINQLVYPASVEPDNNSPSRQEIAKIKGQLELIPGNAHTLVNKVTNTINEIVKATDQVSEKVNVHKKEVDELKEEVAKAESIADVRREQSDALKHKNVGNYHSSWIGLWRPLHEDTRMGLFIAALMFLLVAVVSVVFVVRDSFLPATKATVGGLIGGFSGLLRRK